MKGKKLIIIIITSIIILGVGFGIIDYMRTKDDKLPLFALKLSEWKSESGETKVADNYYGLGYKIVDCSNELKSLKFGFYFSRFICMTESDSDIDSVY
ncbi:MAG: hypothetical protein PHY00_02360 [Bacilli bacterium]|nr:hypothetical protein [Bacilli bacterium]